MRAHLYCMTILLAAGTASAVAAPAPELEDYRWAVGQYSCTGETMGEGAHVFRARFSLTRELGGGVYVERYIEEKTAEHPQPFSIMHLWTYDSKNRQYVRNGVDGDGGRHEHVSSGWKDGVWTWDAGGFRIPITRGDNQFSFSAELRKDGNWIVLAKGTCKK